MVVVIVCCCGGTVVVGPVAAPVGLLLLSVTVTCLNFLLFRYFLLVMVIDVGE